MKDQANRDGGRPGQNRSQMRRHGGVRLGQIFGIDIIADFSLLVIFALVAFSLAMGLLPSWHPAWGPVLRWGVAVAAAILFFASVLVHELSHALVARVNDIPVRRITLFIFGGVAEMEAEPPSPRSEFLMAIVGPITSIVLGVGALLAGVALSHEALSGLSSIATHPAAALERVGPLPTLLLWLGPVNILLGLFNLVPGFPLDGGRVFRSIAWWITGDLRKATRWASAMGQGLAWLLMGTGVAMAFGIAVPFFGRGFVQGLWLLLIGWFLNNAAKMSYHQLLVRQALAHVSVAEVMRRAVEPVRPDLSIAALVREHVMNSDQRAVPVVDGDRFVGLVCLDDVRRVPESDWALVSVAKVMTPLEALATLPPDADADAALDQLARRDVDRIPIVQDGHLLGLIRRQDIMKWLALRARGLGDFGSPSPG